MEKRSFEIRELVNKHQENCERIREIADVCEKENRERNAAEETEYKALVRENDLLSMKMQAVKGLNAAPAKRNMDAQLREILKTGKAHIIMKRDIQTSAALDGTGIIPYEEQEMLKPLRAGLIYDKVGLTIRTGLVGHLRWPKHTKAVASFAEEGVALADSAIDFSALETQGYRLGVAIPVTKQELDNSEGIVENVIKEEMPAAIADCINTVMFTTESGYKVTGPFVKAAESATTFAGSVPTRKELLKMRASVIKAGVQLIAPCWVMTDDMKAELEDVKIDAGSGRFLCENDMILGHPVFTTLAIGDGNIGFGDWSYQAAGFFGNFDMVVDPYTLARNNAVDFVLNVNFGTVTLREEAFVLGKATTA